MSWSGEFEQQPLRLRSDVTELSCRSAVVNSLHELRAEYEERCTQILLKVTIFADSTRLIS